MLLHSENSKHTVGSLENTEFKEDMLLFTAVKKTAAKLCIQNVTLVKTKRVLKHRLYTEVDMATGCHLLVCGRPF